MKRFEIMSEYDESDRAPTGVCELSIKIDTDDAFSMHEALDSAIKGYVEPGVETKAFGHDSEKRKDSLMVYTGTDRLDIATIRDIAEVYSEISGYSEGNIPPEMSLVVTSNGKQNLEYFAWFEFKLDMELPTNEVDLIISQEMENVEVVPKNPIGENQEAIVFRDGNVANHQVKKIVNRARITIDSLPIDYVRVVCEPKGERWK